MSEEAKRLGARLKAAREKAGLSQADLADAAGVPVGTIRGWEQGRREPLASAVCKLAVALDVPADELLGCREGWDEPQKKRPRKGG